MTLVFLCILLHMHYHTLLHNYEHYHKNNMFHFLSLSVLIEVCLFVGIMYANFDGDVMIMQ